MSLKKNDSKPLSVDASNFIAIFRQQQNSQISKSPQNKAPSMEAQDSESPMGKPDPQDNFQMQSDSAMEAQQLFGNLIPQNVIEPKKQRDTFEQKAQHHKKISKQSPKQIIQQQKITQTKSILKRGKITDQIQQKQSFSEQEPQQQKKAPTQVKKSVKFQGILPLNSELQKKWADPIENQRKGKFDKQEERILSEAVGKFLVSNNISLEQFQSLLTMGERSDKISRKQKIFSLLSTALPNRSPQSCYKYLKRNFNSLNRKGKWSEQQIDKLKILVEKYGRKWILISKELKRSSDNCYDKFRELGQENMDQRIKGIWRFSQVVELLKLIEKMTQIKFLQNRVDKQLGRADIHDAAQKQEVVNRKYNSKNFIFHNIAVLKPYINAKQFQKIDISQIRWNQIATYLKTRNILDCRNKMVQLFQIFFHSEPKQLDDSIVNFLIINKYQSQHEVNWKDWKHKQITQSQAKNRYMILKKMVQGRSIMPFKEIVFELKRRLQRKSKEKVSQKQRKDKQKQLKPVSN